MKDKISLSKWGEKCSMISNAFIELEDINILLEEIYFIDEWYFLYIDKIHNQSGLHSVYITRCFSGNK